MYVCVPWCMPGACGGHRRLQIVISYHVDAGNWTQVIWKMSKYC